MRKIYFISLLLAAFLLQQCNTKKTILINDAQILHQNQFELTEVIIYDIFSPPVASRIYAYSSLASFEAMRFQQPGTPSIAEKLKGFSSMPKPEKGKTYNYTLAATKAFFIVVHKVVFSLDSLKDYEDDVYNKFKLLLDDSTYINSIALGDTIGKTILARAAIDNYPQTRGKPKFIGSHEPGKWRPTPPDYMDAVESCWGTMKCFVLDSSTQFTPPKPPKYSMDKKSMFYKNVMEVYDIGKNLTEEQKNIARYWDDNPFVVEHSGHMMFANKKITPGGHWMGIASIACKKAKADEVKTAQTLALTAIALMEGFISCWDEKFRSQVVRPVTVINASVDADWAPFLQTPPFPEYPSGHSAISAAAATVLTKRFGDNFSFHDDSDKEYIGMEKDFNSFYEAASEVSISRVYGGIHYRSGVEAGTIQGKQVGLLMIEKIKFSAL